MSKKFITRKIKYKIAKLLYEKYMSKGHFICPCPMHRNDEQVIKIIHNRANQYMIYNKNPQSWNKTAEAQKEFIETTVEILEDLIDVGHDTQAPCCDLCFKYAKFIDLIMVYYYKKRQSI
jgi:hypothetical protein